MGQAAHFRGRPSRYVFTLMHTASFSFFSLPLSRVGRAHALLSALLPSALAALLPSAPVDRSTLLQALSSGQLLCASYNTGVRRSRKPWGYVSKDSIHDIASLESQPINGDTSEQREKTRRGWTFRRTDNLRLWAAYVLFLLLLPASSNSNRQGIETTLYDPPRLHESLKEWEEYPTQWVHPVIFSLTFYPTFP